MVRVGIIGTGGIAGAHVRSLGKIEGVKIAGVTDVVKERAEKMAQDTGAQVFDSYDDMLDAVDVVYICTPPHVHRDQVIAAAKAKKPIFCEKPLAVKLEDADVMVGAVEEAGVKVGVGYVLHFFPAFKGAHDVFASGELGDLVSTWSHRIGNASGLATRWVNDPAQSGGMTVEFFTHDLDWHLWIGGLPTAVYARMTTANPAFRIEDNIMILLSFQKGFGMAHGSWSSWLGDTSLGIIGTKGTVALGRDGKLYKNVGGTQSEVPLPEGVDAMYEEDKAFIQSLLGGPEFENDIKKARNVLAVALAAQRSSAEGRKIELSW